MGFLTNGLLFVAVVSIFGNIEASGSRCPPPSKIYGCEPVCRDDYDCRKHGKICCLNLCHTKSCTYPAPYSSGGNMIEYHKRDFYNIIGGPGIYCGNVKCSPFEKCVRDPYTGKLRCKRA